MSYEETQFYRLNSQKANEAVSADEKLRNNVDKKPAFFVMVASDLNIRLILSGLMGKQNAANSHLLLTASAASSSLILELVVDTAGKLKVEGYFNDQPVQLGGCQAGPCDAATFLGYLESATKINDVAAACKPAKVEEAQE